MSATKKLKSTKKRAKKTTRVGAAAFAIGLYLAGPQVGVAAADSTDDDRRLPQCDAKLLGGCRHLHSRFGVGRLHDGSALHLEPVYEDWQWRKDGHEFR